MWVSQAAPAFLVKFHSLCNNCWSGSCIIFHFGKCTRLHSIIHGLYLVLFWIYMQCESMSQITCTLGVSRFGVAEWSKQTLSRVGHGQVQHLYPRLPIGPHSWKCGGNSTLQCTANWLGQCQRIDSHFWPFCWCEPAWLPEPTSPVERREHKGFICPQPMRGLFVLVPCKVLQMACRIGRWMHHCVVKRRLWEICMWLDPFLLWHVSHLKVPVTIGAAQYLEVCSLKELMWYNMLRRGCGHMLCLCRISSIICRFPIASTLNEARLPLVDKVEVFQWYRINVFKILEAMMNEM